MSMAAILDYCICFLLLLIIDIGGVYYFVSELN